MCVCVCARVCRLTCGLRLKPVFGIQEGLKQIELDGLKCPVNCLTLTPPPPPRHTRGENHYVGLRRSFPLLCRFCFFCWFVGNETLHVLVKEKNFKKCRNETLKLFHFASFVSCKKWTLNILFLVLCGIVFPEDRRHDLEVYKSLYEMLSVR